MGEKAGAGKKNEVRKEIFSEISRADGLKLEVLVTEPPEGMGLRGILQISHGMCEHKERYLDFMEYISSLGFACLIHDHRGHGASVRAEGDLGYICLLYTSTTAPIRTAAGRWAAGSTADWRSTSECLMRIRD